MTAYELLEEMNRHLFQARMLDLIQRHVCSRVEVDREHVDRYNENNSQENGGEMDTLDKYSGGSTLGSASQSPTTIQPVAKTATTTE